MRGSSSAERHCAGAPRALAALASALLLAALLGACGGASAGGTSSEPAAAAAARTATRTAAELRPAPLDARVDADHDNDVGAAQEDTNHRALLSFGRAASPAELRAIKSLIGRYYALADAEDGARACLLVYSTLAESTPEDDSREPGTPAYMHDKHTCAEVLSALFVHYHAQLAAELPRLAVTSVRLQGHQGWAFLSFGALPRRRISVQREGRVWKLAQIGDVELP